MNSLGEEMKLNQISNHSGTVTFDVHDLPAGFYVLQVKKEDEVVNLKFVKE
ncbi:MAG: T9SS type A sorting domain-containing protein [Chitinophagales bacterium]|nr:T9SS type A sorting domain-containing protein [Chitinophagales bacterium]